MAANRYNSVMATIATNNCYPTFGSVKLHVGEKWAGVVLALSFHLLFRIVEK